MKPLILAAMLLFSTSANANFYDEPDKVLHTQYSAVGAHALKAIGLTPWQSFWTMMLIGVVNEIPICFLNITIQFSVGHPIPK